MPGLVEIAPTDSGGTATFDADNGAYAALGYLEKPGHEITNADIPPEVDAKWRGLELENGMLSVDGSVKDVYFGVAWRILKADGTYRYVRYYKGTYGFASSVAGKKSHHRDRRSTRHQKRHIRRYRETRTAAYTQ